MDNGSLKMLLAMMTETPARNVTEHRIRPRHDVLSPMTYRLSPRATGQAGEIRNVSETGVFIIIKDQVATGSTLYLTVEPQQHARDQPVDFIATVIWQAPFSPGGRFGYGCQIDRLYDPNLQ